LVTDCHRVLARWWNHISQLCVAHGVSDVRQTKIHTAGPLVFDPRALGFEIAIYGSKPRRID
jgi:hypothetical protein